MVTQAPALKKAAVASTMAKFFMYVMGRSHYSQTDVNLRSNKLNLA